MIAAKSGYIAEFVTGYLQREVRMELKVADGIDSGLRDPLVKGIAVGRLAKVDGGYLKPAANLEEAQYIVAQSDDTVRNEPRDYNYPERYSTLPNLIVKNSEEVKTVALYKLVNKDDVKLVKISEPVEVLTAYNASGTFTVGATTYQFIPTGVNQFKVIGTAPYISSPIVSGNPAGNYLYFGLLNSEIDSESKYNAALNEMDSDAITYRRISAIGTHELTKADIANEINTNSDHSIQCEVCIEGAKEVKVEVMWRNHEFSVYTFDLSELKEANA